MAGRTTDSRNPRRRKISSRPGYTFGTVTDQIATVVLTKRTPLFWFGGLRRASACC